MDQRDEVLRLVRDWMGEVPFNAFLGISVSDLESGRAVLRVPFRPEFIGDATRPALHGGIISTLVDTCGGAAVWSTVNLTDRVSTIDLRVDYLRPGRSEALMADGRVIRVGNRVGVVTVRAYHESTPDETVAEGKGVYLVKRVEPEAKQR